MHAQPIDVPATLRAARCLRQVSQRKLAELAGVPLSTVERIEAGRSDPRVGTLVKLLAAIGVELQACVGGQALQPDPVREQVRDAQGRHFPQHWGITKLRWPDDWWGWHHNNPKVVNNPPEYTYWQMLGPDDGPMGEMLLQHRWQDAT
jgi:transcriptional regulator with XRE-family HTH domain